MEYAAQSLGSAGETDFGRRLNSVQLTVLAELVATIDSIKAR